jgi:SAM-dependent methyltransferase
MTDKLDDPDGFYRIQYEDRLRLIRKHLSGNLPRSIMDIGAGYGDFLRFMKSAGWETQGLEPSRYAYELIKDRKELGIKCANVDELKNPGLKPASVVTINNVLEHLNSPWEVLEAVRDYLLLPNGIVFIAVPNDFSVLQNLLMQTVLKDNPEKQNYWVQPPEHLNYWSCETIPGFLQKCRFEIKFLTADFPMEIFPLMGEDYVTKPDIGRKTHLKRVSFEKHLSQSRAGEFKDSLYSSLAQLGIGRNMYVVAGPA